MAQENQAIERCSILKKKVFPVRKTGGSAADVTIRACLGGVYNPRNSFPSGQTQRNFADD
jgi:hypothetical protein